MVRSDCIQARVATVAALLAGVVIGGCGARTGLTVPDVEQDAAASTAAFSTDAGDAGPRCVPGWSTLTSRGAEIMLVIDRSGSMDEPFDASTLTTRTRWVALRDALSVTLPMFANLVPLGATFYPQASFSCIVAPHVDVEPALDGATRVLNLARATRPGGETPTYDALRITSNYLVSRASLGRARFMMLATDGGPTCNPDPLNDFDLERTVRVLEHSARAGVPTFVVGLDDPTQPTLSQALTRMAVAGGRPNLTAGQQRYYSVRRDDDLAAAFRTVQRSVARCVLLASSRPDATTQVDVQVQGRSVPQDTSHVDGWDWTDPAVGEISLFGPTCDLAAANDVTLSVFVGCRDD